MKTATALLAVLTISSLSQAQSLRAQVVASNNKVQAAMMKKDFKLLEKVLKAVTTSDFKYSEEGREQTFKVMMANMKMGLESLTKVKATTDIVKLTEAGKSATGQSKHMMSGMMVGPDKKAHKMVFNGVSDEKYRKEGKVWKMSSMSWKTTSMTMDGKPVDPSQMGGQ